jgi:A/G-specific adenine glycosylase
MLQQTQVSRVKPKYEEFLGKFPDIQRLAKASLADVLKVWSGLGYNRRAKFLHESAKVVVIEYSGKFPQTVEQLALLPGLGKNTAGAVLAYAFNLPTVFIETNIRTVYIHHFFADKTKVADSELIPLIEETLDYENPREWYWALMDYGSYLKAAVGNLTRSSRHYSKQSRFEGSLRQVRGQVLRLLSEKPRTARRLQEHINDERLPKVLESLLNEKLISKQAQTYHLG